MKVSEIAGILDQANLPALTREQLHELAGCQAGKGFGQALRAFAAGDVAQRDVLEATVRAIDPQTRATLHGLGANVALDKLIEIARIEQCRFFDAVDAIAQRSARAARARHYLVELGVVPTLPSAPAAAPTAPPYYSLKIFGASTALCIAEARTRSTNEYSINVEGAVALAGPGPKTFDWPNKIVVQLTVQECYQLLALFENKVPSVRFDGHGARHDKSLHAENQSSHYFVKLFQRGRPAVAVQVRPVDVIRPIALLYRQLQMNEPHLRIEDIRAMVERMASMTRV